MKFLETGNILKDAQYDTRKTIFSRENVKHGLDVKLFSIEYQVGSNSSTVTRENR